MHPVTGTFSLPFPKSPQIFLFLDGFIDPLWGPYSIAEQNNDKIINNKVPEEMKRLQQAEEVH